jgi:hypothetical protein
MKSLRWWKTVVLGSLVILVGFMGNARAWAADKAAPAPMKLKVGDPAPDFTLLAFDGKDLKKVALHDYHGKKNVALAFYVFAFTGG